MTPINSNDANDDLVALYRTIAQEAVNDIIDWPASSDFVKMLDRDGPTTYKATEFTDGQGPFGIMALFNEHNNSETVALVDYLKDLFQIFYSDLQQVVLEDNGTSCSVMFSQVPHLTIVVFQEHPRILPPSEWKLWKPTSECKLHELANTLDEVIMQRSWSNDCSEEIVLELDSIILTVDGAMIAGFVDTGSHQPYLQMKQALLGTAINFFQSEGVPLTPSRKKLIHITLGRVLTVAGNDRNIKEHDDSSLLQKRIKELVKNYNQVILPSVVKDIKRLRNGTFKLRDFSLLRNKIWLCVDNVTYRTWTIS
jgi:hypothetical protein